MSIRQSPKLKKAVSLINSMEVDKFELFLERILLGLKNNQKQIFNEKELGQLQSIFNIEASEITLLMQSCAFLFEQVADLKLQRNEINRELLGIGVSQECADKFLLVWSDLGPEYLGHLRDKLVGLPTLLDRFEWNLTLPFGSSIENNSQPKTQLKLKLSNQREFAANFTAEELSRFFAKLEMIQAQIDSLI